MLKFLQKRGMGARILLGFVGVVLGAAMLISLLPGSIGPTVQSADAVAQVGDRTISMAQVQAQLRQITEGRQIPPALQGIYAEQVIDNLVFDEMLELEAERMGIRVTPQEQAERIRRAIPSAQGGNTDQYRQEVEQRTGGLTVAAFEEQIRKWILREKFAQLVTDGVTVSPEELEREFRKRNDKITIEYAIVSPDALLGQINPSDSELTAYFEKNRAKYQVPERRLIRFAQLTDADVRSRVQVTDEDLRAYYNEHLARFQLQNRAKVRRIMFSTLGKTEAEVEEIRRKAEDVLKQARRPGAKFEELAKQHSDDTNSKDKGGDIGWIVPQQTEAEFERVAFSLPRGAISDLVRTKIGFDIVKVEDREQARTQPLEEVRASILPAVLESKVRRTAQDLEDKVAEAIRMNTSKKLDDIAREFNLVVREAGPAGVREPWGELGFSPEMDDAVFRLRQGELSPPLRQENGFVVLELKQSLPAHQGAFEEVRTQVLDDFRREKSGEMAKERAQELAAKIRGGAALAATAKAAGLAVKTSESFAQNGTVPDIGSARPLAAAFSMAPGTAGPATSLGANWVVYRVVTRESVKPEEFVAQMQAVRDTVLQSKRTIAYEAFREALRQRLISEGKLQYNEENRKRLMNLGS
jgi:peptidyl-prolyl cis-trans isomerase D